MSDEQLRIATAEAMGWKHIRPLGDPYDNRWVCFTDDQNGYPPENFTSETLIGLHPSNCEGASLCDLPNFLESLDACASFEATMTDDQWDQYRCYLMTVIYRDDRPHRDFTPRQRCIAYLATVAPAKLKP